MLPLPAETPSASIPIPGRSPNCTERSRRFLFYDTPVAVENAEEIVAIAAA
jgi:hypothetical protein